MYLSTFFSMLAMASFAHAACSASPCPAAARLSVRLPPYLDPAVNAAGSETSASSPPSSLFEAPPTSFFAGTWLIRKTSAAAYHAFGNMQWDLAPAMPTCEANTTASCPTGSLYGVLNGLTTWAPADNKTALNGAIGGGGRPCASVRAYNTPRRLNFPALNSDWDAVFDNTITEGSSKGYMQSWSVMRWSLDASGLPFMVVHEAPALFPSGVWGLPAVHVISANGDGVDMATLGPVLQALKGLGNDEVTEQIDQLGDTKWDESLIGGPAICADRCQRNKAISA